MSLVFLRACDIFFTCHKKYHIFISYKRVTLYLYDIIDILLYDCMILLVLFLILRDIIFLNYQYMLIHRVISI